MSNTTGQPLIGESADDPTAPRISTAGTEFIESVYEMVADHAPRLFAIVLEYGDQVDAGILAWGLALDGSAYVVTIDGKNQYLLSEPENALKYMPCGTRATPHLIWVPPLTTTGVGVGQNQP